MKRILEKVDWNLVLLTGGILWGFFWVTMALFNPWYSIVVVATPFVFEYFLIKK
jgi:hypothetical protein